MAFRRRERSLQFRSEPVDYPRRGGSEVLGLESERDSQPRFSPASVQDRRQGCAREWSSLDIKGEEALGWVDRLP